MPIISKRFDYKREQKNGQWKCRMRWTDGRNKNHYQKIVTNSEAEADAILDTRDIEMIVKESEAADFREHIEDGNNINDFILSSLTLAQVKSTVLGFVVSERNELLNRKKVLDLMVTKL